MINTVFETLRENDDLFNWMKGNEVTKKKFCPATNDNQILLTHRNLVNGIGRNNILLLPPSSPVLLGLAAHVLEPDLNLPLIQTDSLAQIDSGDAIREPVGVERFLKNRFLVDRN